MKPMIVAELSGNHLGDVPRAARLINAAHFAGADAVKIQCFTPEQMVDADMVIEKGPWAGRRALDLYRETALSREQIRVLFGYAKEQGVTLFASVFHPDDVDFLETLGCPQYKISSFEIKDTVLIERVAKTGKPIIISTGMATLDEVKWAMLQTAPWETWYKITVLKCTSAYPAPLAEANLLTMRDMGKAVNADFGLSDHTLGHTAAVVATALGATMIEKHLTLSRKDGGPDAAFSAEPEEFKAMVNACREAAEALGTVHYGPTASEADSLPLRRVPGGKRGEGVRT